MHKVGIVCGRVATPGAGRSRRFDDSLSTTIYVITVLGIRRIGGVPQKRDFTDTALALEFIQRALQVLFVSEPIFEFDVFGRLCIWVADYHFNVLIAREWLGNATGNRDDRSCR